MVAYLAVASKSGQRWEAEVPSWLTVLPACDGREAVK